MLYNAFQQHICCSVLLLISLEIKLRGSLYGTYRYKGILEVRLVFREYSIGVKMKNSGTIEVLQRYVKALCFLDVLEMVVR